MDKTDRALIQADDLLEIALSIGKNPDIEKMLEEALSTYFKKLDCTGGVVFQLETTNEEEYRYKPIYSKPTDFYQGSTCLYALGNIPTTFSLSQHTEFSNNLPYSGQYGEKEFFHFVELPGFGLLFLVRRNAKLDGSVMNMLKPLNQNLAYACTACIENEMLMVSNKMLKNEIDSYKRKTNLLFRPSKTELVKLFGDGIVHDIYHLFGVIRQNASLAKKEVAPENRLYYFLDDLEKMALRVKNISQRYISFSKGEGLDRKRLSIKKLIENIVLTDNAGDQIKYKFSFPQDLWDVEVEIASIQQAFINIIKNAREAMGREGVIDISASNIDIDSHELNSIERGIFIRKGQYVKISIMDRGKGITRRDIPNIFDPLFSTKRGDLDHEIGGGLTVVYSIIKRHEGYIHVESEHGIGTLVYIYLPAAFPVSVQEPVQPGVPEETPPHKKHVLIMDDDELVLELTAIMLGRLGYDIETAKNGDIALDMYRKAIEEGLRFDAVILDLTVNEGMDGEEAIKRLREIDPGVKAIATSGYSDSPVLSSYKHHGFLGALTKPFMVKQLESTLQNILGAS